MLTLAWENLAGHLRRAEWKKSVRSDQFSSELGSARPAELIKLIVAELTCTPDIRIQIFAPRYLHRIALHGCPLQNNRHCLSEAFPLLLSLFRALIRARCSWE